MMASSSVRNFQIVSEKKATIDMAVHIGTVYRNSATAIAFKRHCIFINKHSIDKNTSTL
jgi:hypothetical protein